MGNVHCKVQLHISLYPPEVISTWHIKFIIVSYSQVSEREAVNLLQVKWLTGLGKYSCSCLRNLFRGMVKFIGGIPVLNSGKSQLNMIFLGRIQSQLSEPIPITTLIYIQMAHACMWCGGAYLRSALQFPQYTNIIVPVPYIQHHRSTNVPSCHE